MGYYSEVAIAMRKKDRDTFLEELVKNEEYEWEKYFFCDSFKDENGNFTEEQKYVACNTAEWHDGNNDENTIITILIPETKWYNDEEPFIEFMKEHKAPYKLVRIGEYPFDCEEVMCFFKDEDQDFLYTKLSKYVTLKNEINIGI